MSLSDTTPCNEESHTDLIGRVSEHLSSRRSFLTNTATIGGGALTLSAFGSGTAAASSTEGGSGSDGDDGDEEVSDIDVLNFALTLEHLEAAYYNEFLDEYSEHDVERSDVAAIFVNDSLRYSTYQFIQAIRDHEEAHVEALTRTIEDLGGTPVEAGEYEFPYDSIEEFAGLSAQIEAVGVSAYAGAAPLIENDDVLAAALSIHSVEARHTSYFRVLDVSNPYPNSFDPARTMDEVLEIASQLVVGMESGDDRDTLVSEINDNGHYARFPFPTKPDTWARSQNPFDRSEGESRWLAEPASGGEVRCLVENLPANANAGFDVHVGPLGDLDDVTIESEVVRTQWDSGALLAVAVDLDADDNGEFFEWKDPEDSTDAWVGFGGDSEGLTALPADRTVTVDDSTEFPLFHVAEEGAAATLGELKAGDVNGADGTTIDGGTNAAIYVGALSAGEGREEVVVKSVDVHTSDT